MPRTDTNPEDGRTKSSFDPGKDPDGHRIRTRSGDGPPPHAEERRTGGHRLPAQPGADRRVHGPRTPRRQHRVVARLAKTFDLPVVLSTVNVANGQEPTIPELKAVLSDSAEIDRTEINSWENADFRRAVEATGRKKLIMTELWTEVCLAFPSLDAMREGYEVYPSSMRSEVRRPKLTVPGSSACSRPARNPSAGSRWRANSSATGRARKPLPTSSTSC